MSVSFPLTTASRADAGGSTVEIPQYRQRAIVAVWAAAALPMAALYWLVAPALKGRFAGDGNVPIFKALVICLTAGLIWQFVLVAVLVWREQRTFRWPVISQALWLRSPRSPRTGRRGRNPRPARIADIQPANTRRPPLRWVSGDQLRNARIAALSRRFERIHSPPCWPAMGVVLLRSPGEACLTGWARHRRGPRERVCWGAVVTG
jgi:hypothetical protein